MPSGRTGNATEPVPDHVLQPILAAALHLVGVLGPHVIELQQQVRAVDRVSSLKAAGLRHSSPSFPEDIKAVLAQYTSAGTGLPMMEDHDIAARIADGWAAEDPLLPLATGALARTAGYSQFWARWIPTMRGPLEQAVASVGVEKVFGRDAADTPAADGSGTLPWTLPLHRSQAVALIGTVRTASIIVLAAVSGMRASELMALRVGCRRPVEEPIPGLHRFRIASKIVKVSPWAAPTTSGSSSNRPTGRSSSPNGCTRTPTTGRRCSGASPSRSATPGSGPGSTPRPGHGSAWTRSRKAG
ncbi:hypothetical protein [Pseudarthrobacter sp. H2]